MHRMDWARIALERTFTVVLFGQARQLVQAKLSFPHQRISSFRLWCAMALMTRRDVVSREQKWQCVSVVSPAAALWSAIKHPEGNSLRMKQMLGAKEPDFRPPDCDDRSE